MTAPDAAALLPCPFCGNRMKVYEDDVGHDMDDKSDECPIDYLAFPLEAWNRRTPPADRAVPVAWKVRDRAGCLLLTSSEASARQSKESGCEVEPLYAAPAQPDCAKGWKLVPVELTKEMSDRIELSSEFRIKRLEAEELWWTFLQAAPPAPEMAADRAEVVARIDQLVANMDAWFDRENDIGAVLQLLHACRDILAPPPPGVG